MDGSELVGAAAAEQPAEEVKAEEEPEAAKQEEQA